MLLFVFFFFLMIRRPPRSTLSSSSAASDVYKRQIPPNADLDFDVRLVSINGKQIFYSEKHAETYAAKLAAWKAKELAKYDSKEEYKTKKDEKHTDRAGFEAFLDSECERMQAGVPIKPAETW
eukprot:TRINITY_DN186_c0_g1_i1.p3 TRINITY_DN186_c0_g1~~TRINITY_DN186_c0_g1_i1.p3  ORF type:complete len:123 (+),score=62.63 TRINITY_DN186_c0_g1_i1:111-479(+)